jgi:hypothetical protein
MAISSKGSNVPDAATANAELPAAAAGAAVADTAASAAGAAAVPELNTEVTGDNVRLGLILNRDPTPDARLALPPLWLLLDSKTACIFIHAPYMLSLAAKMAPSWSVLRQRSDTTVCSSSMLCKYRRRKQQGRTVWKHISVTLKRLQMV